MFPDYLSDEELTRIEDHYKYRSDGDAHTVNNLLLHIRNLRLLGQSWREPESLEQEDAAAAAHWFSIRKEVQELAIQMELLLRAERTRREKEGKP